MAATFASASSQFLSNAAPAILDYPFTVGVWVNFTTTAAMTFFCLADTAAANNYFILRQSAVGAVQIAARAGGTENATSSGVVATTGVWYFVLGRFITSTNRRIAVLGRDGAFSTGAGATARAPAGADRMAIGALSQNANSEFMNGFVAEFWLARGDVLYDSASDPIIQELSAIANRGPFSNRLVRQKVIEYHSLREGGLEKYKIGEDNFEGQPLPTWVNNASVGIGPHVPLPYWYETPGQRRRVLTV